MYTRISELIGLYGHDPLLLLKSVGGFYETKMGQNGKRLTPLVGYAAKYDAGHGKELQYVGDVYANFAKAEEHPLVMLHLTSMLWNKLKIQKQVVFVGPAMGGIAVAQFLALHASQKIDARYACAEKKIVSVATESLREQSVLQFARHNINPGDKVIIVEDVLNNFSTTNKLINLVEKIPGCKVEAIVGLLNRSENIDEMYEYNNRHIPIVALVRKPYPEYKQNDPRVIEDVAKDNMVLKPKDEWHRLEKAGIV